MRRLAPKRGLYCRGCRLLIVLFLGGTALTTVHADVPERFDYIPKRNVFGLKPAPPPEQPPPPAVERPAVLLTGITTILGDKRALFKTRPIPGQQQAAPGKEESFILSEGQREGPIEVLRIDENAGAVSVNLNGDKRTLTLERDGPKPSSGIGPDTNATAVAAQQQGAPGIPTFNVGIPAPGGNATPPAPTAQGTRVMPNRLPRLPATGSGASAVYATNLPALQGQAYSITPTQPTTPVAPTVVPPLPPGMPQTERPRLTPEEQQILQELQQLDALRP